MKNRIIRWNFAIRLGLGLYIWGLFFLRGWFFNEYFIWKRNNLIVYISYIFSFELFWAINIRLLYSIPTLGYGSGILGEKLEKNMECLCHFILSFFKWIGEFEIWTIFWMGLFSYCYFILVSELLYCIFLWKGIVFIYWIFLFYLKDWGWMV